MSYSIFQTTHTHFGESFFPNGRQYQEDTLSSSAACDATGFAPAASATYFLIGGYSSTVDNVQSYDARLRLQSALRQLKPVVNQGL